MTDNVSTTLNLAADLIESRGWIGSENSDEFPDSWGGGAAGDGPLCMEGGILAALGVEIPEPMSGPTGDPIRQQAMNDMRVCPAYKAVEEYLKADLVESMTQRILPVYRWNDQSNRTASEVVEVLRATALIAEARERQDGLDGLGGFVGGLVATA